MNTTTETTKPLSKFKPGQRGIIDCFSVSGSAIHRLQEMGLLPGTEIEFLRKAPFGDPLEIRLRGYNLSLRKAEAATIAVRPA